MKKERFELPDEECERLTRSESMAVQLMIAGMSNLRYIQSDLADRLQCVPSGRQRMAMLMGAYESLLLDLCGTITDKQRHHLQGVCKDMEMRLVPKMTPRKVTVLLTAEEGKELVDAAQARCVDCYKDYEESRKCKLCKLLECVVPLNTYDACSCPYGISIKNWEN